MTGGGLPQIVVRAVKPGSVGHASSRRSSCVVNPTRERIDILFVQTYSVTHSQFIESALALTLPLSIRLLRHQEGSMRLRPTSLTLKFSSGVSFDLDTSQVEMSPEQRAIYDRLAREQLEISDEEVLSNMCPLETRIPRNDFESIRNLRIALGNEGAAAGLICDFCLHCLTVEAR